MQPEPNNTFCYFPFMQLAVKRIAQNGYPASITPCCNAARMTDPMGMDGTITTETLDEIFHSPTMQKLRQDMLTNVKSSTCQICWRMEKEGMDSFRLHSYPMNMEHEERQTYVDNPRLDTLDITSSLKCNLRCRMCGPGSSHKFIEHEMDHFSKLGVNKEVETLTGMDFTLTGHTPEFRSDSPQYQYVRTGKTKINHLKVSGGEPMYDADFLEFLSDALHHNPEMSLGIHTNATQFSKRTMDILNRSSHVNLTFSIDGTGSTYDYIRHPATWDQLEKSIDRFMANIKTNYAIRVNVVSQVYNVLNLGDLFQWIIDHGWVFSLSDVYPHTRGINIRNLPRSILDVAIERVLEVSNNDSVSYWSAVKNLSASAANSEATEDARQRIKREIELFDNAKSQSYLDHLDPILIEWLNG